MRTLTGLGIALAAMLLLLAGCGGGEGGGKDSFTTGDVEKAFHAEGLQVRPLIRPPSSPEEATEGVEMLVEKDSERWYTVYVWGDQKKAELLIDLTKLRTPDAKIEQVANVVVTVQPDAPAPLVESIDAAVAALRDQT